MYTGFFKKIQKFNIKNIIMNYPPPIFIKLNICLKTDALYTINGICQ